MKKTIAILCLAACAAIAQTAAPVTPAAAPSVWFVGTGVEYNPYYSSPAFPNTAAILPAVHVGGCWTSFCEISTLEFSGTTATVRQDLGYKMKSNADNSAMLIAIVGGGLTTTTATNSVVPQSVTLGSLGAGFAVKMDVGAIPPLKALKGKGVSLLGEMRIAQVSSLGVAPQLSLWIDYRFK